MNKSKLPPHNIEVEKAVIGALLIDRGALIRVAKDIDIRYFYKESHILICESIMSLYNSGRKIDIITVVTDLNSKGNLDVIGGAYYITELTDKVVSSANIEEHINILRDYYNLRQQIIIYNEKIKECYDFQDSNEIILDVSNKLMLLQSNSDLDNEHHIQDLSINSIRERERQEEKNEIGYSTGIKALDKVILGIKSPEVTVIAGRPAMGKLQPLTEPVLTPHGWVKMGDIKKGSDIICPVSGGSVKVREVYPQKGLKIYRITFNDGTYTECCNDHLWKIQTAKDSIRGRWRVVDLNYMIKNGHLDSRNKSKYKIPLTEPVEFNKKEVILNPYFLGLLLSNGYLSSRNTCTISSNLDSVDEIYYNIKDLVPYDVLLSNKGSYDKTKSARINISSTIRTYLKDLNLIDVKSRRKFVPKDYLFNSVKVRKEILAGLLDGDGSCFFSKTKKRVSYSTMSEQLRDDVIELVRSLGGTASFSIDTRDKYKGGYCYNINIRTPFNPFKLERKRSLFDKIEYSFSFSKTIRKIEFSRIDEGQCIEVNSKDHLYITRDYIVTHNTAVAINIVKEVSKKVPVALFSLEMSSKQIYNRLLSDESKIHSRKIKVNDLTPHEMQMLSYADQALGQLPIIINDTAALNIDRFRSLCAIYKHKYGVKVVVIDYLQLMTVSGKNNMDNYRRVTEISGKLKRIAKELDIAIIPLAQLSREVEQRPTKKPMLSDLKESGAIEQDADNVIFLWRPEYYGFDEPINIRSYNRDFLSKNLLLFIVAKCREGETTNVPAHIDLSTMSVQEHPDILYLMENPELPF